jgi:hypothetical protein
MELTMQIFIRSQIIAATILLAGCGGGDGSGSQSIPLPLAAASNETSIKENQPLEGQNSESNTSIDGEEKPPEAVEITDATHKSSTWINHSPELFGNSSQDTGGESIFNKSVNSSTVEREKPVDGIVVNVDGDFEQHRGRVIAALEEGIVVVLDSSGSESSQLRIRELSFELANIGAKAAAVMLYKGGPDENVGLLAFGAEEKSELTALMKRVGRRGSEDQNSQQSTNQE